MGKTLFPPLEANRRYAHYSSRPATVCPKPPITRICRLSDRLQRCDGPLYKGVILRCHPHRVIFLDLFLVSGIGFLMEGSYLDIGFEFGIINFHPFEQGIELL